MTEIKSKKRINQTNQKENIEENFEQLLTESLKPVRSIKIGDKIDAVVVDFNDKYVFLDMGTRLDGVLNRSDLPTGENKKLAVGQTITVHITGKRDGAYQCSSRLGAGDTNGQDTKKEAALMALEDAYNNVIPVEGKVTEVTKGGFEVQVMGLKAFCPLAHIDKLYCEAPDEHLNKTYSFEIIRFEEEDNNIVLSRREYLKREAEKQIEKLWKQIKEDKVYEGTVTSIRDFGVFVDIGGIEGLLHISEISYERIDDVGEVLQVGQKLDVAIKSIDRDRRRIGLSLKSLMEDPWIEADKKLSSGAELQGKVVRMKTFGAFVQLFPGVDGLVHISRLGTDRRHQHPKEVLNIGDIVTVRVLEVDEVNRKISLTMEKEDGDYSKDLKRLKKEQDKAVKTAPGHMSNLFDDAIKKDKK